MANIFDEIDAELKKRKIGGTVFDEVDREIMGQQDSAAVRIGGAEQQERTFAGSAKDVGVSLGKGTLGIGEAALGIGRIMAPPGTGMLFDKIADPVSRKIGGLKEDLTEYYSPAQQQANKAVADANGFVGTGKEMLRNPSTIAHGVIESLPAMAAGGGVGRGLVAGAKAVAPKAAAAMGRSLPIIGGAAGEGAVSAGQTAESIAREQDATLTPTQRAMSAAAGLGTSIFGIVGGRLADKMKVGDIDTLMAGGVAESGKRLNLQDITKRILAGGVTEGVFEELPQSVQEQMWSNAAMDKPIWEGVGETAAASVLVGGAMGSGTNAATIAANLGSNKADDTDIDPETNAEHHRRNLATQVIRKQNLTTEDILKLQASPAIQEKFGVTQADMDFVLEERQEEERLLQDFEGGSPLLIAGAKAALYQEMTKRYQERLEKEAKETGRQKSQQFMNKVVAGIGKAPAAATQDPLQLDYDKTQAQGFEMVSPDDSANRLGMQKSQQFYNDLIKHIGVEAKPSAAERSAEAFLTQPPTEKMVQSSARAARQESVDAAFGPMVNEGDAKSALFFNDLLARIGDHVANGRQEQSEPLLLPEETYGQKAFTMVPDNHGKYAVDRFFVDLIKTLSDNPKATIPEKQEAKLLNYVDFDLVGTEEQADKLASYKEHLIATARNSGLVSDEAAEAFSQQVEQQRAEWQRRNIEAAQDGVDPNLTRRDGNAGDTGTVGRQSTQTGAKRREIQAESVPVTSTASGEAGKEVTAQGENAGSPGVYVADRPAPTLGAEKIVEHTTKRGRKIRGVIVPDLTREQAKEIDEFSFKKGAGWFIREKHLDQLRSAYPTNKDSLTVASATGTAQTGESAPAKPADLPSAGNTVTAPSQGEASKATDNSTKIEPPTLPADQRTPDNPAGVATSGARPQHVKQAPQQDDGESIWDNLTEEQKKAIGEYWGNSTLHQLSWQNMSENSRDWIRSGEHVSVLAEIAKKKAMANRESPAMSTEEQIKALSKDEISAIFDEVEAERKKSKKATKKAPAGEGGMSILDMRNLLIELKTKELEQGSVVDDRLLNKISQLEKEIARAENVNRPGKSTLEQSKKPPKQKTVKTIAKEGGIAANEAVKEAMTGLAKLFGDPNTLRMGPAFDEETYRQAKPHFVNAWTGVKDVGYSVKELVQYFYDQFGDRIRPYLERFVGDINDGTIDSDLTDSQETPIIQEEGGDNDADIRGDGGAVSQGEQSRGDAETAGGGQVDGVPGGRGGDVRGAGTGDGVRDVTAVAGEHHGEGKKPQPGKDGGKRADKRRPDGVSGQPVNYHITADDKLGSGGATTKARDNLKAIRILKVLQKEERPATKEEQAALVRYVGWGASELANGIFPQKKWDHNTRQYQETYKDGWGAMGKELRSLLTDEEYEAAKRSTLNAHYTSADIIQGIYNGLERLGYNGQGRAIEPGSGVGHFIGLLPATMGDTRFTAVEMDPISAGIAKALYPGHDIHKMDYAQFKAPNNFFDIAIGNPPFDQTQVLSDPDYASQKLALHDFFFVKTMDKVRPGGLMILVTSRYTMDKVDDKARALLSKQADFLGAIRLPQTAFKQNAGTEVVTDVIFLQKREPGTKAGGQPWSAVKPIKTKGKDSGSSFDFHINEYFADNPAMVLGTHSAEGSMYSGNEYTVKPKQGDIGQQFAAAVEKLPSGAYQAADAPPSDIAVAEVDFSPRSVKEGGFYLDKKGKLLQKEDGVGRAVKAVGAKAEVIKNFVGLRDAVRQVLYVQIKNEGDLAQAQKELAASYAKFVKAHGPINKATKVTRTLKDGSESVSYRYPNFQHFKSDPDAYLVAAIERYDPDSGATSKADIFTKRVISPVAEPKIESLTDALHVTLYQTGRVDIAKIAALMDVTEADAIAGLAGAVYYDPNGRKWVTDDEYLSGNVKEKLKNAKAAAQLDAQFERNVAALEAVLPEDIPPSKITISLGMPFLEPEHIERFAQEIVNMRIRVSYLKQDGSWSVVAVSGHGAAGATSDYGTNRRDAAKLLDDALNGRAVKIFDTVDDKRVLNKDATEAANAKLQKIKDRFKSWVWEDSTRADMMAARYNDEYNNSVPRSYGGDHIKAMTFPGMSATITPFDHQKRVAWRIVQKGNTYMAHSVGSGKTISSIIAGQEQKRLGIKKKPMWVVPNHMLKQFAGEFLELYPAAKIIVADEEQFDAKNRNRFMGRVAAENWDGVIITHSAFGLIPMSPDFQSQFIQEQLDDIEIILRESKGDYAKTKQIERLKKRLDEKLKKILSAANKDKGVTFEETGIDQLFVDEAHAFRKLDFTTNQTNIRGIDPSGSVMSFDMYSKIRYLETLSPGRSATFMSGTPITNTIGEVYSIQRYLQEDKLKAMGLHHFDSWAATFGSMVTSLDATAGGTYKPVTKFAKFDNMPALASMWAEIGDSVHARDLHYLKRPKVKGGGRKLVVAATTELQRNYKKSLAKRIKDIEDRKGPPQKGDDIILTVITDGRHAALDDRYIDPYAPERPDSKMGLLLERVQAIWQESKQEKSTQMIFCDAGLPGMEEKRGFSVYTHIKRELIKRGVPEHEIAFMQDYKKSDQKIKLFEAMNRGDIRVVIGSSEAMGTGVNAQKKLLALHHFDPDTYLPANIEQREGRIIRQGNENEEVQIFAYVTQGSYDEQMWQFLETKQRFIDQFLAGSVTDSSTSDIDGSADSFAEARAMSSDNPLAIELAGVQNDLNRLESLYRGHLDDQRNLALQKSRAEASIGSSKQAIRFVEKAIAKRQDTKGNKFAVTIDGKKYDERTVGGEALISRLKSLMDGNERYHEKIKIGEFAGYSLLAKEITLTGIAHVRVVIVDTETGYTVHESQPQTFDDLSAASPSGFSMQLENAIRRLDNHLENLQESVAQAENVIRDAGNRIGQSFEHMAAMDEKRKRLAEIKDELEKQDKQQESEQEMLQRGVTSALQRYGYANKDSAPKYKIPPADRSYPALKVVGESTSIKDKTAIAKLNKVLPVSVEAVEVSGKVQKRADIVAGLFKKRVVFFQGSSPAVDPGGVMIRTIDDVIFINVASGFHDMSLIGHELLHHLKNDQPGIYQDFLQSVERLLNVSAVDAYRQRLQGVLAGTEKISDSLLKEEILADFVGDQFTSEQFWKELARQEPTVFRKIGNAIVKFIDMLLQRVRALPGMQGDKIITDLTKARSAAVEAFAEYGRRQNAGELFQTVTPQMLDSKEFQTWFGSSKVKSSNGKPWTVYHGSPEIFYTFDRSKGRNTTSSPAADLGHFFTMDKTEAMGYSRGTGNVQAYYLRLEKPYVTTSWALGTRLMNSKAVAKLKQDLVAKGHDGLYLKDEGYMVAFDNTQIKSAETNTGAFDRDNPDVRYQQAKATELRQFLNGEPVAEMDGTETPTGMRTSDLVSWAADYFKKAFGGMVVNRELGDVVINRRSAKDSLSHGYGPEKVQALYLAPHITKYGRVIHQTKRGAQTGYMVSAPVRIAGEDYVGVVVVRKDDNMQRMYVHEVIMRKRLQLSASKTAASARTVELHGAAETETSIKRVLQDIFAVNEDDSRFAQSWQQRQKAAARPDVFSGMENLSPDLEELSREIKARLESVKAIKPAKGVRKSPAEKTAGQLALEKSMTGAGNLSRAKIVKRFQGYETLVAKLHDDKVDIHEKLQILAAYVKKFPRVVRGTYSLEALPAQIAAAKTEKRRLILVREGMRRIDRAHEEYTKGLLIREIVQVINDNKPTMKGRIQRQTKGGIDLYHELYGDKQQGTMGIVQILKMSEDAVNWHLDSLGQASAARDLTEQEILFMQKLSTYGGLKNGSVDEVQQALDALKDLISEKRIAWSEEMERLREQRAITRTAAVDTITGGKGQKTEKERQLDLQDKAKMARRIKDFLQEVDDKHQSFEWLLDKLSRLDKGSGILDSFLVKTFAPLAQKATTQEQTGISAHMALLHEKMVSIYGLTGSKLENRLNENAEVISKTGIFRRDEKGLRGEEIPMSQNQAYKRWQEWQDPTLQDQLISQGYDMGTIAEIEAFMSPEVRKWAEWQLYEFYPRYYGGVNAEFKKLFYTDLPFNRYYTPIRREKIEIKEDSDLLTNFSHYSAVINGSLRSRVDNVREIKLQDGDSVLAVHIAQMEHFKAWAAPMRELRAILGSESVKTAIRDYHGTTAMKELDKFLDDFAQGKISQVLDAPILQQFRGRFTTAVVGANPVVFLKQLTSFPAYAMDMPADEWVKNLAKSPAEWVEAFKVLGASEVLQARYGVGFERDMIAAMTQKVPGKLAGTRKVADRMMALVRLGDKLAIVAGGWPLYSYTYDQAIKGGSSEEEARKLAMTVFETVTERNQQSGHIKDLNAYQRGGPTWQLFTMFMTAPNAYYRQMSGALRALRAGKKNKGDAVKRLFIANIVLPVIFQVMASAGFDDDDLLRAILLSPLQGLTLVRDISMGVYDLTAGNRVWDTPGIPPVLTTYNAVERTASKLNAWLEKDDWVLDKDLWELVQAAGEVTGQLTGVPIGPASRVAEGLHDAATGDTVSPVLRAVGYSESRVDNANKEYLRLRSKIRDNTGKESAAYRATIHHDKRRAEMRRNLRSLQKNNASREEIRTARIRLQDANRDFVEKWSDRL